MSPSVPDTKFSVKSSHFGGTRYSVLVISEVLHLHEMFQWERGGKSVLVYEIHAYSVDFWQHFLRALGLMGYFTGEV